MCLCWQYLSFISQGNEQKKQPVLQRRRPRGCFNVRDRAAGSCELLLSCRGNPAIATFITRGQPSTLRQSGISSSQLLSFH